MRAYVFSGIGLYALFLAATMPATLLDGFSNHFSKGIVRFSEAQGTIWHGSATLGIQGQAAGRFSWKIAPAEIAIGRLHVSLEGEKERGDLVLTPSKLELARLSLSLPASLLGLLDKRLESIRPGGEIHVQSEDFMLSNIARGEIVAQWDNANSPLVRVDPLGSYRIHAYGQASKLGLSLETLNGPLFLKGSGSWSRNSGLQFSGTGESKEEGLSGLLRIAGPAQGNGVYSISLGAS